MNTYKPYNKIQALHKEECDGILLGTCYIQEKIDGANASIWMNEDGTLGYGSRTRDLTNLNESFNGFAEYVKSHEGIKNYLRHNPTHRLYGEWLVRHTISYNELSYKQFYLFDIETPNGFMEHDFVISIAQGYGIKYAEIFAKLENPTLEDIKKVAGTSVLGTKGEGVVIKNHEFINKFGNMQYAKYVTPEFKEDNAITFGGNNKSSEKYNEMYYVNKFMTLPRIQKIVQKLEAMEGRLDMKHIPRVMEMSYYDLIQEEGWSIAKEMGKSGSLFDFKAFNQLCNRKSKSIFIEIITGDISVANL